MKFPRIHLAIDNCFASKRWTEPREWLALADSLGLRNVEASADTEADPLYMGAEYMQDWTAEVARCETSFGVKVVNLYSGHGTYTTLGLGHHDRRVRDRIRDHWVKPMLTAAQRLRAGLGFFCHAFPNCTLQDPQLYVSALRSLEAELSNVATFAAKLGVGPVGIEQMYSPHLVPWTIEGARDLLCAVNKAARGPCYLTIDTGHQTGQKRFVRPNSQTIAESARSGNCPWLGPQRAHEVFQEAVATGGTITDTLISAIEEQMFQFPHLFAKEADSDPYAWLQSLGRYSPIIHLQQVVDQRSSHLPFTDETNEKGIIKGEHVLRALLQSCLVQEPRPMPQPCSDIYLTLEVFSGTSEWPHEIIRKLRESVRYWRRWVPEDGKSIDQLVAT
jgi:sugar phosphate isomerase/epimerase